MCVLAISCICLKATGLGLHPRVMILLVKFIIEHSKYGSNGLGQ